jgi:hypothetical protein
VCGFSVVSVWFQYGVSVVRMVSYVTWYWYACNNTKAQTHSHVYIDCFISLVPIRRKKSVPWMLCWIESTLQMPSALHLQSLL